MDEQLLAILVELKKDTGRHIIQMGAFLKNFYDTYLVECQLQINLIEELIVLSSSEKASKSSFTKQDMLQDFIDKKSCIVKSNCKLKRSCDQLEDQLLCLDGFITQLSGLRQTHFLVNVSSSKNLTFFALALENACKYFQVWNKRMMLGANNLSLLDTESLKRYRKLAQPSLIHERELMSKLSFCDGIDLDNFADHPDNEFHWP